jgi:site-specific DNA-cytosine methylase
VPDSVLFYGTTAEAYRQVGNGVPVPLGEAVGRELALAMHLAEAPA